MTLAASTHIEHAKTVIVRQVLNYVQRLQSAAAEAMQIDDAFAVKYGFIILETLPTMPDEGAFDLFVPFILNVMQIFNEKAVLIEIEG